MTCHRLGSYASSLEERVNNLERLKPMLPGGDPSYTSRFLTHNCSNYPPQGLPALTSIAELKLLTRGLRRPVIRHPEVLASRTYLFTYLVTHLLIYLLSYLVS